MTTTATAPGKVILVGEHAVVYGQPAIAAPVWQRLATVTISSAEPGSGCTLRAPAIGLQSGLADAPEDQPLAHVARLALHAASVQDNPDWIIHLQSDLPIASGLGSGAALSTALVRAIFAHAGQLVTPEAVSALVFESEKFYHGNPSGIDNTVVAFGKPIWFVRGETPQTLDVGAPLTLLIADSGIASPTRAAVEGVRLRWLAEPARMNHLFAEIGTVVEQARRALHKGDPARLGALFDRNHALLVEMGVSSPELDRLVATARVAGAWGAKLSGGGQGGNIIAIIEEAKADHAAAMLMDAGARDVIVTTIK